jgi:peptidoglycan/LPS O-acetylase OafA/YrhL
MKNNKLELIRGLASLMVFFCHSAINFETLHRNGTYNLLVNWGTESVIVFFILSGIVICISYDNNPKTANEFVQA